MGYGRLGGGNTEGSDQQDKTAATSKVPSSCWIKIQPRRRVVLITLLSLVLIIASAISATLVVRHKSRASGHAMTRKPTRAISVACSHTLFPALCVESLLEFPGSTEAGTTEQDLVHVSFNMTLQRLSKAFYHSSTISYLEMDQLARSAYDDCLELLEDSVHALSQALSSVMPSDGPMQSPRGSAQDVTTWLSAALTNQDTCAEGWDGVDGTVKDQMSDKLKDLSELVSNSLAIFSATETDHGDFGGVPIQNRRRLMEEKMDAAGFPKWLGKRERELLDIPAAEIQADIIVSKDGGAGTFSTIEEAIKRAPECSDRRIIIYVRAGRYEEEMLKVGRKKTNLMFIGDGQGKTVVTGKKSVGDKITTFHTASFAATGAGFIARDISFENYAGPEMHQAVALRIGADHAVFYRCNITGYQDTLYVHSNRHFFRDCNIYGTVDFIFGNAAVVFQRCNIYARKPMAQQKNTITAQSRKDPNQNTGISIHGCRILATSELEPSKGSFPTYLGRPWKKYSRVVYMLSYMGDHISPEGWLEWSSTFALNTLYYGEYMNTGPGSGVAQRVKWQGYRVIKSQVEASKFTVAQFIYGSTWLPTTGVAFVAGLSV